jgi:zinc D-Ala-D-Ala carboxypeptidase
MPTRPERWSPAEADTLVLDRRPAPSRPRHAVPAGRPRPARSTILVALAVAVAVAGAVGHRFLPPSSSTPPALSGSTAAGDGRGALSAADGVVPAGVTVFDDVPAVANLDPDLLDALRRAATDAGVGFAVNSGWRSRAYQEQLLREAVAKYGSAEEAARWVSTPDTSRHVSGDAVDIGPPGAAAWLSEHGAGYGLCQTYRNEPWHYELRPGAVEDGCPPRYADAAHDPRMQGSPTAR